MNRATDDEVGAVRSLRGISSGRIAPIMPPSAKTRRLQT